MLNISGVEHSKNNEGVLKEASTVAGIAHAAKIADMISEHHKNKKARVIQEAFKKYKKEEEVKAEGKVKKLFNTFKENAVMSELLKALPADNKNKNTTTNTEIKFLTEPVMEEAPIRVKKIRNWSEATLKKREERKAATEQGEKQPKNPKEKKVYQLG